MGKVLSENCPLLTRNQTNQINDTRHMEYLKNYSQRNIDNKHQKLQ